MSNNPTDLKYSTTHQWIRAEADGTFTVGITDFAQQQLGDVVFVELPENGADVGAEQDVAVVESVKSASDVYAPVAGRITAINEALPDTPELVNEDPYGKGWFFKIEPVDAADLDNLLDADAYAATCE